jgi:hypothetical protein
MLGLVPFLEFVLMLVVSACAVIGVTALVFAVYERFFEKK